MTIEFNQCTRDVEMIKAMCEIHLLYRKIENCQRSGEKNKRQQFGVTTAFFMTKQDGKSEAKFHLFEAI